MAHELGRRGLKVATQVPLPIFFDGLQLDIAYRIDLLVEDSVIVEVKAADQFSRLYEAQVLTYLKFAKLRLGYLVNFNVLQLRQGLRRLVL